MTKKIPDFKSLEEAADYWDTHSFADHIQATESVEIEVCLGRRRIFLDERKLTKRPLIEKIAHPRAPMY